MCLLQFYQTMASEDITEHFLWQRLEPFIDHLAPIDQAMLRNALGMAIHAHEGQQRKSGEPFVTHPVEVARILAEMGCEAVRFSAYRSACL